MRLSGTVRLKFLLDCLPTPRRRAYAHRVRALPTDHLMLARVAYDTANVVLADPALRLLVDGNADHANPVEALAFNFLQLLDGLVLQLVDVRQREVGTEDVSLDHFTQLLNARLAGFLNRGVLPFSAGHRRARLCLVLLKECGPELELRHANRKVFRVFLHCQPLGILLRAKR